MGEREDGREGGWERGRMREREDGREGEWERGRMREGRGTEEGYETTLPNCVRGSFTKGVGAENFC
jgi:hypothetical protein